MLKVAIPTRGNLVDDHFGHCEMYTIFTTDENNKIIKSEILPSPQGCGCKSNIAYDLKQIGVSVMLAGNMGGGALNVLNNQGINVVRGCSGDVKKVAEDYLQGQIVDSGEGCHHHDHSSGDHQCNH